MYANASVIGRCRIGDYVIIGVNAFILNEEIPDNSIVYGNSPNIKIRQCTRKDIRDRIIWLWKESTIWYMWEKEYI